jgi:choline kinase
MQAIILCAGMGVRIKDLTRGKPKCLLNICGKSILEHQIDAIKRYTTVPPIIVVGYKAEMIKSCLENNNVRFVYNPDYAITNVLASLWYALPEIKKDVNLICMPGDLIFDHKIIKKLLDYNSEINIAVQKRECDDEAVKVLINEKKIISIGKQLEINERTWEFIGMLKVEAGLVENFREVVSGIINNGERNGYVFTALQEIINKGGTSVGYVDVKGYLWEEIDFAEDYDRANKKFLNQGLFLE